MEKRFTETITKKVVRKQNFIRTITMLFFCLRGWSTVSGRVWLYI